MNKTGKRFRDAVWLLIAQTIGAFNDNVVKSMLLLMALALFDKDVMGRVNSQLALMIPATFVLFGPLAGWLSDRYSKRSVVSLALLAQVVGLLVIGIGIGTKSLNLAILGFFLLATQSAMLSPGKKGILKELVGSEKLGMAVGWMEMLTMVGILGGIYVGAEIFVALSEERTAWDAGQLVVFAVAGLAFFSWLIFKPTPRTEPKSAKPFEIPILWSHFGALRELRSSRPLLLAALGDAWFWAFGGFFFLVLVEWATVPEIVRQVGDEGGFRFWFGLLGVGIMLGSMISAYVGRGRVELGIVPLGALAMPMTLICLTLSDPMSTSFNVCCVLLGIGGAFFFVPLNAFLQDQAGDERRGRVVAASNLLTNLLSIVFIGIHYFLSGKLNLNPIEELWVMTVPAVLIAGFVWYLLPEEIFRIATRALTRIFYRLSVKGVENLPKKGGALILCNHVSYADPVMIGVSLPRYLQFIAFSGLAESWLVRFVFRLTSAIPVSPSRAKEAIVKSSEKLRSGDAICIFPEG
ncbi:MAG: MFS transporter, partial [Opitutae bacterium]|nr:MFS transporter [Opitutae bacterium]